MTASGLPGKFISREELSNLNNVFLLNPGNKEYLFGTKKRLPGTPRLVGPILLLVLGVIVTSCPVIFAIGLASPGDAGVFWLAAIVLAALFLFPVVLILRKYGRERRLDKAGHLLLSTITRISTRERSQASSVGMNLLAFFLNMVAIFSKGYGSAGEDFSVEDFYEVTVEYTVVTPSGTTITGTAKANRPDLREAGLPAEGSTLVLLYLNDRRYRVM